MHPRKQLRDELKAMIQTAAPGVPVYVSRSRALQPKEAQSILIYVMEEQFGRPRGTGEGRMSRPLNRSMTALIVVSGIGGDELIDDLDDTSRRIELCINSTTADLRPISSTTGFIDDGGKVRCEITMTYSFDFNDKMEA